MIICDYKYIDGKVNLCGETAYVFLVPSIYLLSHLRHTAFYHHPLIYDWLFTCLMWSSILVSKLETFTHRLQSLIPRNIDIRVFGSLWCLKYWRLQQIKPATQLDFERTIK